MDIAGIDRRKADNLMLKSDRSKKKEQITSSAPFDALVLAFIYGALSEYYLPFSAVNRRLS